MPIDEQQAPSIQVTQSEPVMSNNDNEEASDDDLDMPTLDLTAVCCVCLHFWFCNRFLTHIARSILDHTIVSLFICKGAWFCTWCNESRRN